MKIKTRDCGIPDYKLLKTVFKLNDSGIYVIPIKVSEEKMKNLKREIISKIPVSGILVVFKMIRVKDKKMVKGIEGEVEKIFTKKILVPYKVIQSGWGLRKKFTTMNIDGVNIFDVMRSSLESGEVIKYVFRCGFPGSEESLNDSSVSPGL